MCEILMLDIPDIFLRLDSSVQSGCSLSFPPTTFNEKCFFFQNSCELL